MWPIILNIAELPTINDFFEGFFVKILWQM